MDYHIDFNLNFKRNPYRGKLIVLEGIDGSGKTFQVAQLAKILGKSHIVFTAKNPTDGPIGQLIRKVLREKVALSPVALQYLFAADRQVQQKEIVSHLKEGEIVILDRYFWSAVAYGSLDQKGEILLVAQSILSFYNQHIVPDYTFFLKVTPGIAMKRIRNKKDKEIYEVENKLNPVEQTYEWLVREFPKEIAVIDGTQEKEEVTKSILNKLEV